MQNVSARLKRAKKLRARIKSSGRKRLCVHRSLKHIYAQIIDDSNAKVLASSSTLIHKELANAGGNQKAASQIGADIAKKAIELGIEEVAFDRSGFNYHGRVKALAEAAREAGLKF